MTARHKYRWEIDAKTNEVKRVRAEEMHYEAFEDFKKILEAGAEKANLDLPPRERARLRSRKAEMERRRRRRSSRSECSSDASDKNYTPLQRTRRRRARLNKKVTNEIRRCGNTAKLMKMFPPVFSAQCDGLSGGLAKLGGLFQSAADQCNDFESKIAQKRARIAEMDEQYKLLKKRRTRLMFNKLAEKAKRLLARRNRIKEREERLEDEERNRRRSRSRNGRRFEDDEMTQEQVLEVMAEKEPHAHMALMLNDFLNSAAPPGRKTQLEYKLHIGDCVSGFLKADDMVESTAKDIILSGVREFFRTQAKQKLLGGGTDSEFDSQFGTEFEEDEFVGYTEEDVADMKPEQVTRYYAWQRWTQKQKEWKIAQQIADDDAENAMRGMKTAEKLVEEPELDDDEADIFNTLMDW